MAKTASCLWIPCFQSKVIIEFISQDQNLKRIIPIVNILQNDFLKPYMK